MRSRWFVSLFASVPVIAATLALQSCAGVGGPISETELQNVTQQFLALLSSEQRSADYIGPEACADCHGGRTHDDPIYVHWQETKHADAGVTCERCHGPGSVHQANPTKENILTYPKSTDPVVCGQCHGPITEQYNFSQHAKLVTSPVHEAAVNPAQYGRNSRCISCHSGLMRAEVIGHNVDVGSLTNEQITEIAENTINHVPYSASCVTCHNPHSKTGNLTDTGEDVQLRRKVFNLDTSQVGPGTTAPQFTTFDHICAQCHNGRGTDPSDNKLQTGTARPSMHDSNQYNMLMGFGGVEGSGPVLRNTAHAQAPGQCSKCHMPDSRHTFTVSFDQGCAPCHTAADAAARADTVKSEVLSGLVVLRTRMGNWAQQQFGNSLFWEYTSVISGEGFTPPPQNQVPIEIKRARHNYYFILRSGDLGVHNAPYAKHLLQVANDNLDDLGVPETGKPQMNRDSMHRLIESDRARAARADMDSLRD